MTYKQRDGCRNEGSTGKQQVRSLFNDSDRQVFQRELDLIRKEEAERRYEQPIDTGAPRKHRKHTELFLKNEPTWMHTGLVSPENLYYQHDTFNVSCG